MKRFAKPGFYIYTLFLATFMIAACSSNGIERSGNAQTSLEAVDNDIKNIVLQIDKIGESLDKLTNPRQADVRQAYDQYSENVLSIEKLENDFQKHVEEMETNNEIYLSEWKKNSNEYDNPEIQRLSVERYEIVSRAFNKISENNVGINDAFKTYVSDVIEIETFISNDLTNRGIESISPISKEAVHNGKNLKNALLNLQSAIEEARAEMIQGEISMN
ncbi:MAG: hypothetical protein EA391_12580 [Balneolaceae bacterium]|nr:MAG: hypothetical protein EA391_12580 [Balneolaceae bacterium]